ncbi:MAG: Hsp70 family protein [Anaerolineales bacterium]|nr:Hsp70 family protein [Anaerolineales bacterium]
MGLTVGLDFGTSNSGVAISDGRKVRLLPIDQHNAIPEVVKTILYITRDEKQFIGQEAIELYYRQNVNRMHKYVKKWAGEIEYRGADMFYVRDIFVEVDELKPGRLLQQLKTTLRKGGEASSYSGTHIFNRYYTTRDLIQVYLQALKKRAETLLGEEIQGVVLGRPVKFSDSPVLDQQGENTLRQAALEAGFTEVQFELEPIAAALYYERTLEQPQNVLIFDFGGGTLDIAIMRLGDDQQRRVYASGGIGIAGSDFDRAIIEKRLLQHFGLGQVQHQPKLLELINAVPDWIALPELSTPLARQNLQQAIQAGIAPARLRTLQMLIFNDLAFSFYNQVENAKIALSDQGAAVISLKDQGIDLWELYTRTQFEQDIQAQQEKIRQTLLDTVAASGLKPEQIDAVVKTGGSSSIPTFTNMLAGIFGRERIKQSNTFSSVTAGLAIRASQTNW